ncbi:hypothetical protein D3C84_542140 [compost metagenome]
MKKFKVKTNKANTKITSSAYPKIVGNKPELNEQSKSADRSKKSGVLIFIVFIVVRLLRCKYCLTAVSHFACLGLSEEASLGQKKISLDFA